MTSTLADGQYGAGHEIEILVKFTAPIVVYGVPRLWLDLGDSDGYASFDEARSNNTTNDTLVFIYYVREGIWMWARVCNRALSTNRLSTPRPIKCRLFEVEGLAPCPCLSGANERRRVD